MAGIYIHIPFCKSRCIYCDFYSTTDESLAEAYVQALCREIRARRDEASSSRVCTIYIGGGTPSRLSPEQLQEILECVRSNYSVEAGAEITVELNPEDVTPEYIRGLRGFNRVSLGIQTFDDDLLSLLRRRHDAATARQAVEGLQEAGIHNISIDLIYGLPGQTLERWEQDLSSAFALHVQHLSAYALSYEQSTPLWRLRREGKVAEAPDELSVEMYRRLCQRAREEGFLHYEISNFALPGYESRHNSSYWAGTAYLGFGPGAHGYDGERTRRANPSDLRSYLSSEDIHPIIEELTTAELYNEAVMCGLRTINGIDLRRLEERFGPEKKAYLLKMAAPHLQSGRLTLSDPHQHQLLSGPSIACSNRILAGGYYHSSAARLRLTESALMVSDSIMAELMWMP